MLCCTEIEGMMLGHMLDAGTETFRLAHAGCMQCLLSPMQSGKIRKCLADDEEK